MGVVLVIACSVILFILHNSWYYGIKKRRFCESYLLTSFYLFALVDLMLCIAIGSLLVEINYESSEYYNEFRWDELSP
jgi:uncharacterized membrane protein YphA (DoxX/SURF4 family)